MTVRRFAISSLSLFSIIFGMGLALFLRLVLVRRRLLDGVLSDPVWGLLLMVFLSAHVDRLGVLVSDAHPHAAVGCRDAQIAVAQSPHQVKGLPRWLLTGQPQAVVGHRLLHRRSHLRCRIEVAVRRYQPANSLVRPLEVVSVDEELEPTLQVREVREDGLRQEFVPRRLPEALDFPERHRVLGPALDVLDAFTAKQVLEGRLAAPRRVLTSIVRQNLARAAEATETTFQSLEHQRGLLVVCQRPSDDETRVVVHEARQVHALVPAQQEREDVGLPHLIRLCSLETTRRLGCSLSPGRRRLE